MTVASAMVRMPIRSKSESSTKAPAPSTAMAIA
jgi:hypothetical protein